MIRRRQRSSFDGIIFNGCPRSPWVTLLLSWVGRRTLDVTLWHSSYSRHLPFRLVWDNLHTVKAHTWMWSTQMRHIAFGAIEEISTPKKADRSRIKVVIDHNRLSFKHCINIDMSFHHLWGKTVALVGWFHSICSVDDVSWIITSVVNDWTISFHFRFIDILWIPFHDYMNVSGMFLYHQRISNVGRLYTNDGYVIGKTIYGVFFAAYRGRTYPKQSSHQV